MPQINRSYRRRDTWPVKVGDVIIGGGNEIAIQSMTNTSTMDTTGSVTQITELARAGSQLVRLTAQGVREAANLALIKAQMAVAGVHVPLVADIHFNPKAAFEAARHVEKVRINPGNFVDPGRVFKKIDYTPQSYGAERSKIEKAFVPLLDLCREHGTALRIGVNHGSLSDRIMSRYGDTPEGIVESAMEFLRVAVKHDFRDIVISIKASNPIVMVHSVRLLVKAMDNEGMKFPLHLGVTEAGDGDDGRIKSALGIGTLLAQGLGDTIRVSLSESPVAEIPVARALRDYITCRQSQGYPLLAAEQSWYDPAHVIYTRRPSRAVGGVGGSYPIVSLNADNITSVNTVSVNADNFNNTLPAVNHDDIILLSTSHPDIPNALETAIVNLTANGLDNPVIASVDYTGATEDEIKLWAAADLGALLLNGMVDGIEITAANHSKEFLARLSLDILQAARARFFKTEFISCPGCGRTLFDLQSTLAVVKTATSHLKGLKIGVMGCIVNGPGEMADADYGYVGAAAGHVSLYRGKECVKRNIPAQMAVGELVNLIKEDGKWLEP